MDPDPDVRPRPDPTDRTREELLREIEHLRRLVEAQLAGHTQFSATRYGDLRDAVEQRVTAMERQFELHLTEARQQLLDRIKAQERATDAALVSTSKAIDKAEAATAERFGTVNEFRGQLADQTKTFVTAVRFDAFVALARGHLNKDQFDQHVKEMGGRVDRMDEALRLLSLQVTEIRATSHGGEDREAKARSMFATVMAGLAVAVAVASLVLPLILR
jgi:hypothetical protein